jgi:hypothetical protein
MGWQQDSGIGIKISVGEYGISVLNSMNRSRIREFRFSIVARATAGRIAASTGNLRRASEAGMIWNRKTDRVSAPR